MAGAGKKRHEKGHRDKPQSSSDDKSKSPDLSESLEKLGLGNPPPVDGNRDSGQPRSRSSSTGSQPGSQPGSQSGSQPPGSPPAGGSQMIRAPVVGNKNIDAGAVAAFRLAGLTAPNLPFKPKTCNRTGRETSIKLNAFPVGDLPRVTVYQYDVAIEQPKKSGAEKTALSRGTSEKRSPSFARNRLIWESVEAQQMLHRKDGKQIRWIYDNASLAWTNVGPPGRYVVDVNVDAALGRTPNGEAKYEKLVVTRTKALDFAALESYLNGEADWTDTAYEALNFLDHLMRERPGQKYTQIKRNFFARGQTRAPLGGGVEAFKGVYSSVRPVCRGFGIPGGLSVNVDVANTTFWIEGPLHLSMAALFNVKDGNELARLLRVGDPKNDEKTKDKRPKHWNTLLDIKRLKVYYKHLKDGRPRTIEQPMNVTANEHKFDPKDPAISKGPISVADYFLKKHKVRLQFPNLPLVRMAGGTGAALPMEQCFIMENQRYGRKLTDRQTAEMIKFAVTPPAQRWQSVQNGIGMLDWQNDENLREYGLKISTTPTSVKGRVLVNPKVLFGPRSQQNPVDPKTSGRWDLRGKQFIQPHKVPLSRWGVCIITSGASRVTPQVVQNFAKNFINVFNGHGGQMSRADPVIMECGSATEAPGKLFNAVGRAYNADPQLLMFVIPKKEVPMYGRIKRECDCALGIPSQVLLASNVEKGQGQYCSNVSMKVNAKLGGWTAQANGVKGAAGWFSKPTMVIGADVSHAAPGTSTPSVAALTMSWDTKAIKYIAAVESNGFRTEMVSDANFDKMLGPMIKNWMIEVSGGRFPQHIIYVRDGVAEGQYPHVLNGEVESLRRVVRKMNEKEALNVKFTVVVVTKRHHVRMFPEGNQGDRNGNPLPGTLVETGMTSPYQFDFLLCAHSAIKGTARPAHYHLLLDEEKMKPEELQQWIYECSYQYVRSTTPVSLFPAAYYADLAAGRAVCHAADWTGDESEAGGSTTKASEKPTGDGLALKAMPPNRGIRTTMWFV